MKKTLIVAALFAAAILGMTSCDKNTNKCWKVETTGTAGAISATVTTYMWTTENEMEVYKADIEKAGGTCKYSAATSYKTEADCVAQNKLDL